MPEGSSVQKEADPFTLFRKAEEEETFSYAAGFPHYPRNFSRDTINAGIIASSADLLASQLEISARYQGKNHDPGTGEMPGRIHHEFPGVSVNRKNKSTTYNACDTTALFVIAADALRHIDAARSSAIAARQQRNVLSAVDHILECVDNDGMFVEKPPGNGYDLRVTYWKDSILPHPSGKIEPVYPVIFSQAHFIAARGLLSASSLLRNSYLAQTAHKMFVGGIRTFIRPDGYTVYKDAEEELQQASSDELHSLAYIPDMYADALPLDAIKRRAESLATPFGYMCTPKEIANQLSDNYHGDTVWVFEQAMINYGATKFGLSAEAEIAASVADHIGEGQELFGIIYEDNGNAVPVPQGNDRQLWSKAASIYFAGHTLLLSNEWL